METKITILRPDGTSEERDVSTEAERGYREGLRPLLVDILDGAGPEHVAVLNDGKRADMFVDADGLAKALPRNEVATAIYRAAWLSRITATDPESMPYIAGTAILFSRIVWS